MQETLQTCNEISVIAPEGNLSDRAANGTTNKLDCISLQPKMTGAQIRKLRRAKKMANGTWTVENPKKKTPPMVTPAPKTIAQNPGTPCKKG